jgi:hypothetical protein
MNIGLVALHLCIPVASGNSLCEKEVRLKGWVFRFQRRKIFRWGEGESPSLIMFSQVSQSEEVRICNRIIGKIVHSLCRKYASIGICLVFLRMKCRSALGAFRDLCYWRGYVTESHCATRTSSSPHVSSSCNLSHHGASYSGIYDSVRNVFWLVCERHSRRHPAHP